MSTYSFGDFTLDLDAFELRRQGESIRIERRPLDLLILLVKQPGRLVTREEIIAALWPGNVIIDFDAGLNTLVRKVRAALDDSADDPQFIETVPGRGYRFIATAAAPATPALTEPTEPQAPPQVVASPPARRAWLIAVLALIVVAIGFAIWFQADKPTAPTRIAVLPFENLTGDARLAYLASGLAQETSTSLVRVDPTNLRVVGISTRIKPEEFTTLLEVGQRLGVDLIVTSTLQQDGTRIRVTSRLLRVADGEQLWTAAFDRELTNVLGLQRELSTAIAEQIRLSLSPDVAAGIRKRQTENPAAYALFLKGRYEWSQLTPSSTRRALDHYTEATTLDPSYGLAWAEKAFAATSSLRTVDADPKVAIPMAREALDRALKLAPDLVETQYALGYFQLFGEQNRAAAEAAGRAAIRVDPNNSQAHLLLAATLVGQRQLTEARDMIRRSRELDPLFALAFANSALIALTADDPQAALDFAKQSVAINPEVWVGHYYVGRALAQLGDWEGALASQVTAAQLSEGHSLTYSARVRLLLQKERTTEARALVREMEERAARQYFPAYPIAAAHARLGESDEALHWLARAIEQQDLNWRSFPTDSAFAGLRQDPRYAELLLRCQCGSETIPALTY